eukprot:GHRQ01019071.1.p1 GENE.GHRQ01019071.1~~GHRQ01019071.1.p1  ORF type:complete len:258 (+),score=88.79 GHRQ01019071.1:1657-2430(+)
MYQLLQPGVRLLRSTAGRWAFYSADDFAAEYGLQPGQAQLWTDVKALEGDPADNIPGVKGIGQKTALQLVQQLGSLETILESFQGQQEQPEQLQQVRCHGEGDGALGIFAFAYTTPLSWVPRWATGQSDKSGNIALCICCVPPLLLSHPLLCCLLAVACPARVQVKLRKAQLQTLASAEGAAAARFAKQLVTIVTDLQHPPVWQPWSNFELAVPPDGGALAVQRAVNMKLTWTSARLKELFEDWARQGRQQAEVMYH